MMIFRSAFLAFILSVFVNHAIAQISDIEKQLFLLEDVLFEKLETPKGFNAAYKLMIKQPLDHQNPSAGYFYQKVYLSHQSFDSPTVIVTEGYNRNSHRSYELTHLLKANQLDVEHRYYGESIPDSIDYAYLSLEQSMEDLHRINTLFKTIYKSNWVSTGISKGGQTTIYYRYFYPDDVDVSIPYVAPLNLELEETRIYDFLNTIGTEECRNQIYRIQRTVLENRSESLDKVSWYSKGAKLKFEYLNIEEAFEYMVLEYPFSFWQWGAKCEDIPAANASLDTVLDHILNVSSMSFFSDKDMTAYQSHYYQAGTQMGYYSYEIDKFKDVIKALPNDENPTAIFMPNKMNVKFDNSLAKGVYDWMNENGHYFIHINGANDTWSSTALKENPKLKALWFNLKGKDHGQARIKNMSESEKSTLVNTLEEWLDLDIE